MSESKEDLERQLETLENEISEREDRAEELRSRIWALTPRVPVDPKIAKLLEITNAALKRIAMDNFAPNPLVDHLGNDHVGMKVGEKLRIRLPNDFTVRQSNG